MRIIAGIHRSRTILSPKGQATRPITDRVKESLFNRLMAIQATGRGDVLDIFSGTGSLGLEALSRGANHCTFVERGSSARVLLEQNLLALQLVEQATVLAVDALRDDWLGLLPHTPLNLVFCDPPYKLTTAPGGMREVLSLIASVAGAVEPNGVLILRTPARIRPECVDRWEAPRTDVAGSMALNLYVRAPC